MSNQWIEKSVDLKAGVKKVVYLDTPANAVMVRNHWADNSIYIGLSDVSTSIFDAVAIPYGWGSIGLPTDIKQVCLIADADISGVKLMLIKTDSPGVFMSQMMKSDVGQVSVISTVGLKTADLNIDTEDNLHIVDESAWTWKKITFSGAGDQSVKATPGLVLALYPDASESIYLKDGTAQAWKTGSFNFSQPIKCLNDIKVNATGAGAAWILYK